MKSFQFTQKGFDEAKAYKNDNVKISVQIGLIIIVVALGALGTAGTTTAYVALDGAVKAFKIGGMLGL